MIVKTGNDDSSVSNAGQRSVERIAPIKMVSATQNNPERGNKLPDNSVTTQRAAGTEQAVDAEKLKEALQKINDNTEISKRELNFSVDKDSGETVIKIMDLTTKEVIRQIPNEQALSFARQLDEGVELELFSDYG